MSGKWLSKGTDVHFDSTTYQQALGVELRKLRKRRGWTRKQLNETLSSDISLQTLATYELGTRQCSVVRLAELCLALGEQPHEVLARVDQQLFTEASSEVRLDLEAVAKTDSPQLSPLRRWANGKLRSADPASSRQISLNKQAIEQMAALCGMDSADLLASLRALPAGQER